ncbi:MAG: hypothetical protein LBJ02_04515, partial [Bifidobacteriaceae bacterium]|nr:hypothetical protein [Bifidobacteriaceae bacterium]
DVSALSRRELTAFRKSEVGFVFQLYNLVEGLTVYENVNVVRLDRSAHVTSGTRHGSGSAPGTGRPMPQR